MLLPFVALFGLTGLLGLWILPLLRRLRVGQTVRDDGPRTHFAKTGTPTFGGLMFLIPLNLGAVAALLAGLPASRLLPMLLLVDAFAAVGFADDYIKVRINRKGLSFRGKTVLMAIACILYVLWDFMLSGHPVFLYIPFLPDPVVPVDGAWRLAYGVPVVLYLYFVCNSVNLTDGVDGLAASVTLVAALALGAMAFGLSLAPQPGNPWIDADGGVSSVSAPLAFALAGGCAGFLLYNRHPARVFMGDTGSQALGAGVAVLALALGIPWVLVPVGGMYLFESLSVMIQVAYFRKTGGKRIFRMSPFHHHLELGGWSEVRIVRVFTLITLAGSLLGLLLVLAPALSG